MLIAMANGIQHLGIVPMLDGIRVRKQQNQVDFVVGNAGIDLLMAALLMGARVFSFLVNILKMY